MSALGALMLAAVGCTTLQRTQDDGYYEPDAVQSAPSRIYMDDPYHYGRTIVMQRDPFSGRYYEVNPYGYNNVFSNYDSRYYDPYNNRRYNTDYPSRRQVYQQPQGPTEGERREAEQKRQEAKDAILGKKQ